MSDSITDIEKNIKNLQLSQNQETLTYLADESMTQSSINSLKREAESLNSSESFFETAEHRILSNRDSKKLFEEFFINKEH